MGGAFRMYGEEEKRIQSIFMIKPEGRSRCRWKDNIKIDVKRNDITKYKQD
jgi:hypothetical protein